MLHESAADPLRCFGFPQPSDRPLPPLRMTGQSLPFGPMASNHID